MKVDEEVGIPEVYAGRSIFVTGFTGFMGKSLVEKLLWSCPDVDHIYVLVRPRRGLTCRQRFDKIINSDLFSRVREGRSPGLSRVVPLDGDVTLPNLGLSQEQRSMLCQQVSMVFHCAASVKFDDPITTAVDINVKGTKAVIDLALQMPHLAAFLHVSTAYSNCDKFDIEEKVYPPQADWAQTLEIREKVDSATFNIFCQKYMNHMPNTYVFAKSLGEHIVNDHSSRIPAVIFRPSIVVSTMEEPFPGWTDNLNGPVGLLGGYGAGVVRTCLLDDRIMPDFIPVDLAIRGLVVAGYRRICASDKDIHFYNWCTRERSITYAELIEYGRGLIDDAPMKFVLWRPSTHTTRCAAWFYINMILFQVIPAIFIDAALRIVGQKPILMKIQKKVYLAMKALSYFTLNYFYFHNNHGYALEEHVPRKDMPEFGFVKKPEEVDEYKFFLDATHYFQKRFMKMKPEDRGVAEIVKNIMYTLDKVCKSSFWLLLAYYIYTKRFVPRLICGTYDFLVDF